jgi:aminomethyltransferase
VCAVARIEGASILNNPNSIHGKDRVKFIEQLVVASVAELKPSTGVLSFFSNENGGIKDDLIIHNYADKSIHIVANAGCADKDVAHLKVSFMHPDITLDLTTPPQAHLAVFKGDAALEVLTDRALIALQGLFAPVPTSAS